MYNRRAASRLPVDDVAVTSMATVGKTFRSSLSAVNRPATTIVFPQVALKDAFTFRHCGPDIAVDDLMHLRKFDSPGRQDFSGLKIC